MTKEDLLGFCWCRDFSYSDLLAVAERFNSSDIPTAEEYYSYVQKENRIMMDVFSKAYIDDTRTPEQRAKQELGINVEDCER
jgi:hypothetical protein